MEQKASRVRLRIGGIVQGVGFRPFVYALALEHGLGGFVLNDPAGVVIEVEGARSGLAAFTARLLADPPPLAMIDEVNEEEIQARGDDVSFEIRPSEGSGALQAPISPDIATCAECAAEIAEPSARRYGYAFTNCTNCGPRFTITKAIPYDRSNTTMSGFELCRACRAEYEDPSDRRFHAQPIACPRCGPHLHLTDATGTRVAGDALAAAARALRAGQVVAVKGLGGFHLACDAHSETAVARLRARKGREEKPLAVMVPTLEAAAELVDVDDAAAAVLSSRRRPIVLLPRRTDATVAPSVAPGGSPAAVAPSVAPGNRHLGVMLPYTPLHHLLMRALDGPLVMTSGNRSDEPIAYRDDDAGKRLEGIADAYLEHDRAIHVRCDDSVVRIVDGRDYPIRRSRGYAPEPLGVETPFLQPVLGAGPELKHTFCLGKGARAILSHHIGDLATWEAMSAFLEGIEHFERVFDVAPEVVAHDLHPDYLSTKWALELEGVARIGVQHHHAHIASCLADNRFGGRVIGLALDGTGYGSDGAIWGCEVLACDLADFTRHLHLRYVPLPGGAAAVKEPWRMAAAYLDAAFGSPFVPGLEDLHRTERPWKAIVELARTGLNSPLTSSAGRLFDAAAAVCGVRGTVSYEGQAAAEAAFIGPTVARWRIPAS